MTIIIAKEFFANHQLPSDALQRTGLSWDELEKIAADHRADGPRLEATAKNIAEILRSAAGVHSVLYRIKDAEQLLAEVVRSRLVDPAMGFDTYKKKINDIIAVRVIHLFKDEWQEIHQFITKTWTLAQPPIVNHRQGDTGLEEYASVGCLLRPHEDNYRAILYAAESSLTKETLVAEIQVRTIFEEGSSEIDQRLRRSSDADSPFFAPLLDVFNRFAGGTDELGRYIKLLHAMVNDTDNKVGKETEALRKDTQYREAIAAMELQIAALGDEVNGKRNLLAKVDELKRIGDRGEGRSNVQSIGSGSRQGHANEAAASPVIAHGSAAVAAQPDWRIDTPPQFVLDPPKPAPAPAPKLATAGAAPKNASTNDPRADAQMRLDLNKKK